MRILPLAHLAVEVSWQSPDWEFLQPMPRLRMEEHPLRLRPEYAHFQSTTVTLPPWSVAVAPRWLRLKEALGEEGVYARYALRFRPMDEPPGSDRVERQANQEVLADSFFSSIRPGESLIFLYCRNAPMVADGRPILVGVGRVEDLGSPESYETEDAEDWPCLLPYRAVEHSIRPSAKQGFVFPLDQFLDHPEAAILCPMPPEVDTGGEATLLDHDGAWALMTAAERCWERILENSQGYSPLPWLRHQRLRLREWRGDAPGAAAALRALGLRHGPAVLAEVDRGSGPLWERVEAALTDPAELGGLLPPGIGLAWQLLSEERKAFLALLARFSLRPAQANNLYNRRTEPDEAVLLEDPYLLPEVPLPVVDRGLAWEPAAEDLDEERTETVSLVSIGRTDKAAFSSLDPRRIRALMRHLLRRAAEQGHTLLPVEKLVEAAEKVELDPPCHLTPELVLTTPLEEDAPWGMVQVELADGSPALQLVAMAAAGKRIRNHLSRRARRRLDLAPEQPAAPLLVDVSTLDANARERLSVAPSPLGGSAAAGPAAVPDNTPSSHNFSSPAPEEDGARVISFAARKAARRPEPEPPAPPPVVAAAEPPQIGFKSGWPRPRIERNKAPEEERAPAVDATSVVAMPPAANAPPVTTISAPSPTAPPVETTPPPPIERVPPPRTPRPRSGTPDWAALLAELGLSGPLHDRALREREAVLRELWASRCTVLVGPPGTEVERLLALFFRVAGPVAVFAPELTLPLPWLPEGVEVYALEHIPRRRERWKTAVLFHSSQLSEQQMARFLHAMEPLDRLILVGDPALPLPSGPGCPFVDLCASLAPPASSFPRVSPGYAELHIRLTGAPNLRVADWFRGRSLPAGAAEAREVPAHYGVRFVGWKDHDDLWGKIFDNLSNILALDGTQDVDCFANRVDPSDWLILAPQRGGSLGVDDLNRRIQEHFRGFPTVEGALAPVGPQGLRPGDRVVVLREGRRIDVVPPSGAPPLVAGAVGLLTGQNPGGNLPPWKLEAGFGSAYTYGFRPEEFEEDPPLSLGWALSVRWAQHRGCRRCLLVVPEAGQLTREMVYAALQTATEQVIIFHPGPADEIFRDEYPDLSDRGRRLTNLYVPPAPPELPIPGRPGAEHTIAESLLEEGIQFLYQAPVEGPDGATRWPSFRFEDRAGRRIFWEHLSAPHGAADVVVRSELEAWYADLDIHPESGERWGGDQGVLVITEDEGDWEEVLRRLLRE